MNISRLEAFSDGVIAVIITIIVLEMRAPIGTDLAALVPVVPVFLVYLLSFVTLGTYWNNHHHLLRAAKHVTSGIMWANLHLLFWLSLIPFATGWLGENYTKPWPTALYCAVLLMAGFAYLMLQRAIIATEPTLARKIGRDLKGLISLGSYLLAIGFAFVNHWLSDALFVFVALIWLIPDRRLRGAPDQV